MKKIIFALLIFISISSFGQYRMMSDSSSFFYWRGDTFRIQHITDRFKLTGTDSLLIDKLMYLIVADTIKADSAKFGDQWFSSYQWGLKSSLAQLHDSTQLLLDSIAVHRDSINSLYDKSHDSLSVDNTLEYHGIQDIGVDTSLIATKNDLINYSSIPDTETVARTIYISDYHGDDETGDGTTLLTAFKTFGRAGLDVNNIISAQITFQFDTGSYNIYQADIDYMANNWILITNGSNDVSIVFNGTMTSLLTGLSCTKDVSNPFIFDVSGASWSTDQYEGRFISKSPFTAFYPIESNSSNTLEGAFSDLTDGTYNLYEDSTILNFPDLSTNVGLSIPLKSFSAIQSKNADKLYPVRFLQCKIDLNYNFGMIGSSYGSLPIFVECNLSGFKYFGISNYGSGLYLYKCFLKANNTAANGAVIYATNNSTVNMLYTVIKNTSNSYGIGVLGTITGSFQVTNCVVSNFLKAFSYTHNAIINIPYGLYVKDCNYLFYCNGPFEASHNFTVSSNFKLSGITSLFYSTYTPTRLIFKTNDNTGFTNIWDPSSPYKDVYNSPEDNVNIQITGLTDPYPASFEDENIIFNNETDSVASLSKVRADSTYLKGQIDLSIKYSDTLGAPPVIATWTMLKDSTDSIKTKINDTIPILDLVYSKAATSVVIEDSLTDFHSTIKTSKNIEGDTGKFVGNIIAKEFYNQTVTGDSALVNRKEMMDSIANNSGGGSIYYSGQGVYIDGNNKINLGDSLYSTPIEIYIDPKYSKDSRIEFGNIGKPFEMININSFDQMSFSTYGDSLGSTLMSDLKVDKSSIEARAYNGSQTVATYFGVDTSQYVFIKSTTDSTLLNFTNSSDTASIYLKDGSLTIESEDDTTNIKNIARIDTVEAYHIKGIGSAPGISAGAAAGSSPSISLSANSTDVAGEIVVTTGTSTTEGVLATITFDKPYSTVPFVIIFQSSQTAYYAINLGMFVNSTVDGFTLNVITGASLSESTEYKFMYHVIQ